MGVPNDRPQAEALLASLERAGHVIADAAYDVDQLRAFIADDLSTITYINANLRRIPKPSLEWRP